MDHPYQYSRPETYCYESYDPSLPSAPHDSAVDLRSLDLPTMNGMHSMPADAQLQLNQASYNPLHIPSNQDSTDGLPLYAPNQSSQLTFLQHQSTDALSFNNNATHPVYTSQEQQLGLMHRPAPAPPAARLPVKVDMKWNTHKERAETFMRCTMTFHNLDLPGMKYQYIHFNRKTLSKPRQLATEEEKRQYEGKGAIVYMEAYVVCWSAMQKEGALELARRRAKGEEPNAVADVDIRNVAKDDPAHPQNGGEVTICEKCQKREKVRFDRKKKPSDPCERTEEYLGNAKNRIVIINEKEYKALKEQETSSASLGGSGSKSVDILLRITCYSRHQFEQPEGAYLLILTFKDRSGKVLTQWEDTFLIADNHKNKGSASEPGSAILPAEGQAPIGNTQYPMGISDRHSYPMSTSDIPSYPNSRRQSYTGHSLPQTPGAMTVSQPPTPISADFSQPTTPSTAVFHFGQHQNGVQPVFDSQQSGYNDPTLTPMISEPHAFASSIGRRPIPHRGPPGSSFGSSHSAGTPAALAHAPRLDYAATPGSMLQRQPGNVNSLSGVSNTPLDPSQNSVGPNGFSHGLPQFNNLSQGGMSLGGSPQHSMPPTPGNFPMSNLNAPNGMSGMNMNSVNNSGMVNVMDNRFDFNNMSGMGNSGPQTLGGPFTSPQGMPARAQSWANLSSLHDAFPKHPNQYNYEPNNLRSAPNTRPPSPTWPTMKAAKCRRTMRGDPYVNQKPPSRPVSSHGIQMMQMNPNGNQGQLHTDSNGDSSQVPGPVMSNGTNGLGHMPTGYHGHINQVSGPMDPNGNYVGHMPTTYENHISPMPLAGNSQPMQFDLNGNHMAMPTNGNSNHMTGPMDIDFNPSLGDDLLPLPQDMPSVSHEALENLHPLVNYN